MKNLKRMTTLILALAMALSLTIPGFAADTSFTDVASDAWYAGAVEYVVEHELMNGVGGGQFNPGGDTSRAMLVTILWRMEGEPVVNYLMRFPDVAAGEWYTEAVRWAASENIVGGYDNGYFGTNDPVSREQIVTILWRYMGSPTAVPGQNFADEADISSYAAQAVDWSRQSGVVNGKEGNRFDPQGHATRAETATILMNFQSLNSVPTPEPTPEPAPSTGNKTLVVYFSATGSTERVAGYIADAANADTFELVPVNPYTSADLSWTTEGSRVNLEHDDESLRDDVKLVANTVDNWADYDTIFIGYPIWWGIAAWPVNDFVKNNDFTGKTVIPFCTSSSSGLGQSGELLAQMAGTGNWQTGMRFSSGASQSEVSGWVSGLNLIPSTPNTNTPDTNTPDTGRSRVLVTYFSMPETTNPDNMTTEEDNSVVVINGQVLGNTQYMAQVIQETTGADIFRIEPVTPYPTDHTTLVSLASQEQSSNARPAIQGGVDMDNYDVVFVGYPIWWSDMPMIMYTFFDQYDLSGKTVIPFSTHGGSSFAGTPATIQGLEPNARMLDGLTISRNNIQDARQEIVDWVNDLGLN